MNGGIPGWHNLLKPIHHGMIFHSADEAAEHSLACCNISDVLYKGLQAVGALLWKASVNDKWPIEAEEAGSIGAMIECLTDLLQSLSAIDHNSVAAHGLLRAGLDCFGEKMTSARERDRLKFLAEQVRPKVASKEAA